MYCVGLEKRVSQEPLGDSDISTCTFCIKPVLDAVFTENQQLRDTNKKLEDENITDNLTGLYNDRQFYRAIQDWDERGIDFSVQQFDVVNFKKGTNDAYGRAYGDLVLKTIGHVLGSSNRFDIIPGAPLDGSAMDEDMAFRLGGRADEFAKITSMYGRGAKNLSRRERACIAGISTAEKIIRTNFFVSHNKKRENQEILLGIKVGVSVHESGMTAEEHLSASDPKVNNVAHIIENYSLKQTQQI